MSQETVFVNTFTNGVIGPNNEMLGPVKDGGYIVANTAPGCWGPMLTPSIEGGHEVTQPVAVEGAEPGDAIAIRIVSVKVTSQGTSSGNECMRGEQNLSDAIVDARCPSCGAQYPKTHVEGFGPDAIRCDVCGLNASSFAFTSGYTVAFDDDRRVGVTLDKAAVEKAASNPYDFMRIPDNSAQNPVVALAPSDLSGIAVLTRPFMGQLGTVPGIDMPDSHNAGDFGSFLVGAPHKFGIKKEGLKHATDGHMDINRVRAGAILIAPVKVAGGGIYAGDMHAMQGDGEIAMHTCDVSGVVTLQVKVLKGLDLEGPIILPVEEDLPHLARFLSQPEKNTVDRLASQWGVTLEENAPISFVGTGENLNEAVMCALQRAANLLNMTVPQVMNRTTIAGGLEIGRAPGSVTATFKAPVARLKDLGLYDLIAQQYSL
ncbi:MAG: acetamidase/formamidase family protein [Synergistaceae bacterium]|nr:acetamidase/formamidase family protein [Synergistaceae bacterium]